jgi:hypothetical protein
VVGEGCRRGGDISTRRKSGRGGRGGHDGLVVEASPQLRAVDGHIQRGRLLEAEGKAMGE